MSERVPFQVQLTREQHRRLRRASLERNVSMGALIRESVTAYLASRPAGDDPALGLLELFDDVGPEPYGDPGVEHDAYLAEAYGGGSSPTSEQADVDRAPRTADPTQPGPRP